MKTKYLLLASAAAAFVTLAAKAETITPAPTTPLGLPGVWNYDVKLTSGKLQANDGFTIFDFGSYVPNSIFAPAGWTAVAQLTGWVPAAGTPLGPDDPTKYNLIFTYTGATIDGTVNTVDLGSFGAKTTAVSTTFDDWISQDHKPTGALGTIHTDEILVPLPDGGLTVALLGFALVGLQGLRRRLVS